MCEIIDASDGARCARQPGSSGATLCGQGTVCPLSCCFQFTTNSTAASSAQSLEQMAAKLELFGVRACVFAHFFLESQLWEGGKALPTAASSGVMSMATKMGGGGGTQLKENSGV